MIRQIVLCGAMFWLVAFPAAGPCESLAHQAPADGAQAASLAQPSAGGKLGRLTLVEDQNGRLAARLERLLARAGYAVTPVKWDQLQTDRLSTANLDLVILADARRLPAAGVPMIEAYLRAGGKLLAIGGPAFGELLRKTPRGYVNQEHYMAALYDSLDRHPLKLSAGAWVRGTNAPERPGRMGRDGRAWKASLDLDGWDQFGQPITGQFAEGRTLLCFQARGDARTPQLFVECTEKDESRWMATIELSTQWQSVVLRPADFRYWPDSPVHRGQRGDHFNPANVARIQIGVDRGNTSCCPLGPHVLWFRDLATASDPNPNQAQVGLPRIEGLSPSYALYGVPGPLSLRPAEGHPEGTRSTFSSEVLSENCLLSRKNGSVPVVFSPVPRETGIGFDRHRACRWIRVLDGYDAAGRNRGAVVWLMVGEGLLPGAVWGDFGVSDPEAMVQGSASPVLQAALSDTVKATTDGCFLLEAGSRYFSYKPGETIELGALVGNASHHNRQLTARFQVRTSAGKIVLETTNSLNVPAGQRQEARCQWTPPGDNSGQFPYTISVQLRDGPRVIDRMEHRIDLLTPRKAEPEAFVRVEGSQFKLGAKPWCLLGVNYWPNSQGGRATVPYLQRKFYDPELIERDLARMQSMGINLLSGIQLPVDVGPATPGAYRDLQDFVERCDRHGMKLFVFLPWCNPMLPTKLADVKRRIEAAGLRNNPAVLAWDVAWEPIYYSGPAGGQMDFLLGDWNAWLADRYGSLDSAEADWGYKLPRTAAKPHWATLPKQQWCARHGPWDRAVAAFRRFFSDRVGQAYGELTRELRRYDPHHLITFRFGACGIPEGFRFAHAHSASVAKHVDFLCPEGYILQHLGAARVAPADDLRKGGLITLYYRFLSREKPVVWMEFGYTVNDMHLHWKTTDVQIPASQLADQRTEYDNFYRMFLESGARGAAPWWLPGGYRLDERSDFGLLEPDGTPRPACEVLAWALPKFAQVPRTSCIAAPGAQKGTVPFLRHPATKIGTVPGSQPSITLDLDSHYPDGWRLYSDEYLKAVKAGRIPFLRTDGTGTTSANCPLVAVGDTPLNGHNPPKHLNAEFNSVDMSVGNSPWRETHRGEEVTVAKGQAVRCRASVGNIAEACLQAAGKPGAPGVVYLACRLEPSGKSLRLPLAAVTSYLHDAEIHEFTLPETTTSQTVALQMCVVRIKPDGTKLTIPFGERRRVVLKP